MDSSGLLILCVISAVICGAIASGKGRSVVAWVLLGLIFTWIAILIVACLSNVKEHQAQLQRAERDRRRLREQLRQERQKTESFRQHAAARLDVHDQTLGIDTRSAQALPGSGYDPRRTLDAPRDPQGLIPPVAAPRGDELVQSMAYPAPAPAPAPAPTAEPARTANDPLWYYASGDEAQGPITQTQLFRLIQSQTLAASTMVWTEGYSDWVRVDEIAAFGAG